MINFNKKFEGKKLLLLGSSGGTDDMVNYARSQGAYVIVTDNLPPNKSPAKLIADETWPVSTADMNTLEKLSINNRINGVSTGASDFNAEKVMSLCERIGLPFYCNRRQWETCSNKQLFKRLCQNNDIPVAREYRIDGNTKEDLTQIKYPVIVKPVDSEAGKGIRICQNEDDLLKAHAQAISFSKTSQAIVEELVAGDEFTSAYTIKDGQFTLTYMADRYVTEPTETMPLPQANILPSKYIDRYMRGINDKVIKMFQSIGLGNGFIFIQGIINRGGIYVIEANYRLGGHLLHRFTSRINGINYMEMLINYALTGEMGDYDLSLDNPRINKNCCNLVMVSKGGRVGKIIGLEEIQKKKNLIAVDKIYDEGDYIERSGTLRQTLMKFFFIEDTIQELKDGIREIQGTIKVLDDKGNDMLLDPFDVKRIDMTLD